MPLIQAQVRLARDSNLAEDVVVNSFYFFAVPDAVTGVNYAVHADAVVDFYLGNTGANAALRTFMSPILNGAANAHEVRFYDMSQAKPRQPQFSRFFTLDPPLGIPLPSEVALCLSYRAELVSGTNPRRRRGRLFFGPLNSTVLHNVTTGRDVQPTPNLQGSLLDAGTRLMNGAVNWHVYSRVLLQSQPITSIAVDNAFDTQRRRGGDPTAAIRVNAS